MRRGRDKEGRRGMDSNNTGRLNTKSRNSLNTQKRCSKNMNRRDGGNIAGKWRRAKTVIRGHSQLSLVHPVMCSPYQVHDAPLSPDPAGEPHQSDQSECSVGLIAADRWAIVYRDDSAADREGEPDDWPEIETSTVKDIVHIIVLCIWGSHSHIKVIS